MATDLFCFIFSALFPEFFISGQKPSRILDKKEQNEVSSGQGR